jgi:hypothetical protein
MSARIEQTLDVVSYVQERCPDRFTIRTIRDLRIEAQEEIASREEIDPTTVSAKFRRQLEPEVQGTDHFDELLAEWIRQDSLTLRNALLTHSVDSRDERRVRDFFS